MSSRGPVRSISLVRPRGPVTIRKFIPREPLGCVNGESDTIAVGARRHRCIVSRIRETMPREGTIKQSKWLFAQFPLTMTDPLKPLFGGLAPGLAALEKKAAAAQSLTEKVRLELAEALRPHLVSAARRGDDLVVIMDSAAWTARVRYGARTIKERLESGGEPPIDKVQVKVRGRA